MAKVTVVGQAIVVTSEVSLEDIKMVKKYRPEVLLIRDEETKEEMFRVGVDGNELGKYGAAFENESRDDKKLATITAVTGYEGDDIKSFIADELGAALQNLAIIEKRIPDAVKEIKKERETIMAGITLA